MSIYVIQIFIMLYKSATTLYKKVVSMSREKANERINPQPLPSNRKKSRIGIIIGVTIVLLILVGVILYLLFGKESEPEFNRVITPDNVEEVLEQLTDSEKTPNGSYEAVMNTEWFFENGNAASENAYVKNSTNNQNTVYFTIALKDDKREIYKSPYLPVGSELRDIKLDTALDAGVYDTVLTYHLIDDKEEELSTVSLSLTITINN